MLSEASPSGTEIPNTEDVRTSYAQWCWAELHQTVDDAATDFDVWLRAHDAEVWVAGYEAGAEDQAEMEGHRYTPAGAAVHGNVMRVTPNPYRTGSEQ